MSELEIVKKYIKKFELISERDQLLLGLSGGKDSVCLLRMLSQIQAEKKIQIFALHLNHQMRGSESDGDEIFVQQLCDELGIQLIVERYDFQKNLPPGESFENFARQIRYNLFEKWKKKLGCNKIVTAHTLSDNSETILMRIFGGTSLNGLQGISPKRNNVIRPLLCLNTKQVYAYLEKNNFSWREDSSNKSLEYRRNFFRHNVLANSEKFYPQLDRKIGELSELASVQQKLLWQLLNEKYGDLFEKSTSSLYLFTKNLVDDEVLKMYLAQGANSLGANLIDRKKINEIVRIFRSTKKNEVVLLKTNDLLITKTIFKRREVIKFSLLADLKEEPNVVDWSYSFSPSFKKQTLEIMEAGVIVKYRLLRITKKTKNLEKKDKIYLKFSENESLTVRNRRNGDFMQTISGKKKLKKIMIDNKIEIREKDLIPLFIFRNEIIAVSFSFLKRLHKNLVNPDYYVKKNDICLELTINTKPE